MHFGVEQKPSVKKKVYRLAGEVYGDSKTHRFLILVSEVLMPAEPAVLFFKFKATRTGIQSIV